MKWLLSIDCLDNVSEPKTFHFSKGLWNDKTKLIYQNRLIQPALINQSANDGGVLSIFSDSSIGEIELNNTDGVLDFMANNAFDGRNAILNNGTTTYNLGVVARISERNNSIFFSFNSLSESLNNNYPQSSYDAVTWDATLNGKLIPIVFGSPKNITPILVSSQLGIYQVSSFTDCRVSAIYYDGQRLTNYFVDGNHFISNTTIAIKGGTRGITTGKHIMFDGDNTIYTVSTGISGTIGNIIITPGLSKNINDLTSFDVIDLYSSLSALQADAAKIYTDGTKLATKWGSYQGYFHLADAVTGVVTVDCVTVTGTTVKSIYDVINGVITNCGISGLTIDDGVSIGHQIIDNNILGGLSGDSVKSVLNLPTNGLTYIGFYLNNIITIKSLLDLIIKSFGGYYWFEDKELNIKFIDSPAITEVKTINEYQIKTIGRDGLGLGSNGIPIKGWLLKYGKNWTVMTTVAGILGTDIKELLGKDYQELDFTNTTTQNRNLLSEKITIETLLNDLSSAELVKNQLNLTCSGRRDIINITSDDLRLFDSINIGSTFKVITNLLGYISGRKFICISNELNAVDETLSIKGFG